jgi:signal transduction histidine kinase
MEVQGPNVRNRSMDLLKFRSFPALAASVRAASGTVVDRWERAVKEMLPTAQELPLQQIRNSLPDVLETMARALEADDPGPTQDLMKETVAHGEIRFDQNYDIGELMIEYGVLRRILTEEVVPRLDHEPSVEELTALNIGIDVIVRRGVVRFFNVQRAELQTIVEAQTKYLSFLSHDLRGGLNGVLLMIEVLRRDLSTEPKFEESLGDLDVMRRSILETVGTMDRFLHAERFRKGKVQVKPSKVTLRNLVRDVVGHYSYQARDKDLELKDEVPDKLEIYSDRELITIILQNLAGNAIKYSKKGTVRITATPVTAEQSILKEAGVRLSVIDQGPGIAQDRLDGMFTSFTRGETHGQPGTGLGLSIARQAADLLGAKLWAESKVGEGSMFHLDLPMEPPAAAMK